MCLVYVSGHVCTYPGTWGSNSEKDLKEADLIVLVDLSYDNIEESCLISFHVHVVSNVQCNSSGFEGGFRRATRPKTSNFASRFRRGNETKGRRTARAKESAWLRKKWGHHHHHQRSTETKIL